MDAHNNAELSSDDVVARRPSGSCVRFVVLQIAGWLATVIMIVVVDDWGSSRVAQWLLVTMVYGVFFGKLTLGALATVLGPWNLLVRLTVPPAWFLGEYLLAFVLAEQRALGPEELLVGGLTALFWLGLQAPMWLVRFWTRSRLCPPDAIPDTIATSREQFSIAQILGLTLAVAVVLGVGKALIPADEFRQFIGFLPREFLAGAVVVVTAAINGMVVCRFAMDDKSRAAGLVGVVCSTGLLCGMTYVALRASFDAPVAGEAALAWTAMLVGQIAWVLLSLGVLRSAGWRLVSAKGG